MVKSACALAEDRFEFLSTHMAAHKSSVAPAPGDPVLFVASSGTRHTYGPHSYMQEKTLIHVKINLFKKMNCE